MNELIDLTKTIKLQLFIHYQYINILYTILFYVSILGFVVKDRRIKRNNNNIDGNSYSSENNNNNENNFKSIRIKLFTDNLLLDNDSENSCKNIGDRIKVAGTDYTCVENDILSDAKRLHLTNILESSISVLQNALRVDSLQYPIRYAGQCFDCPIPTNPQLQYSGVDADLLLLITARPILQKNVLAFGMICEHLDDYRPFIGQLNFNPGSIETTEAAIPSQIGLVLHEMTHVLGFGNDTMHRLNMTEKFVKTTGVNGHGVEATRVNTPRVTSFVRHHFGCNDLGGAELEDGGDLGTAMSHWERRIFNNEYMTGQTSTNPVLSGLTLAFFEDTGFYRVNYSFAEPLIWGYKLGCNFVNQPCNRWKSDKMFCKFSFAPQCTYDRMAIGLCNSRATDNIPVRFNYLQNGFAGDELSDYCPYVEGVHDQDRSHYCTSPSSSNSFFYAGGKHGLSSRCFDSTLLSNAYNGGSTYSNSNNNNNNKGEGINRPVCYETACLNEDRLKIKVGSYWYDCPYGGEISNIEGFYGSLKCPSGVDVCVQAPDAVLDWPEFLSVEPTEGEPGDIVTIRGENFNDNTIPMMVFNCEDVTLINSTMIIARIANYSYFSQNGNFNYHPTVSKKINIALKDSVSGKNAMGIQSFQLKIFNDYEENKLITVGFWFYTHWYIPVLVGVVMLVAIIFLVYGIKKRQKQLLEKKSHLNSESNSNSRNNHNQMEI
ncbi:hypothetical protein PPL_05105 [Heterostelium album PN500]|uniref:IPT/TIG domain-containing protein n=1 Tax=Heterostelium pallidum (strain ATCC 26659 / Pp 5 / PN500) TaxID=670386 RepID=D3B9G1_HETP5|nr:hypothetical protein PPL_05105 [Heterostelium album PN500]EFA81873.1 hypothetical protein PPL_05105 [Heterostelium album PN500]|eukprot:XP_020433990.1 hypothetical protein PPL_05105 [Heterostelium album PN500]